MMRKVTIEGSDWRRPVRWGWKVVVGSGYFVEAAFVGKLSRRSGVWRYRYLLASPDPNGEWAVHYATEDRFVTATSTMKQIKIAMYEEMFKKLIPEATTMIKESIASGRAGSKFTPRRQP